MQIFPYWSGSGFHDPQEEAQLKAGQARADAQATREAGDYEAGQNAITAQRQNSLVQQLATARRTPGGGIRRGLGRRGMTAGMVGSGLTAANSAQRLARRKAELRAQVEEDSAARKAARGPMSVQIGAPIRLW